MALCCPFSDPPQGTLEDCRSHGLSLTGGGNPTWSGRRCTNLGGLNCHWGTRPSSPTRKGGKVDLHLLPLTHREGTQIHTQHPQVARRTLSHWWLKTHRWDTHFLRYTDTHTHYELVPTQPFFFFFFLSFLGYTKGLGVELEPQLPVYTTATVTSDLSHFWDLCHSLWQPRILNPLSKAREEPASSWTLCWVLNSVIHNGNSHQPWLLNAWEREDVAGSCVHHFPQCGYL